METEASTTQLLVDLQAAPFTSKLLGSSLKNNKNFAFNKELCKDTPDFNYPSVSSLGKILNSGKSKSSLTKMLQEKIEDLRQKRTQPNTTSIEGTYKQSQKTTKFAMVFKLKKEEIKQVQNGDTTILKSFLKNMALESMMKPENFEIMSEKNLYSVIGNIRQAANVKQLKGTKKIELPLGVWNTNAGAKQVHTIRMIDDASKHTQCEANNISNGLQLKPLKCIKSQNSNRRQYHKSTQYEAQYIVAEVKEISPKLFIDRSIQCELWRKNILDKKPKSILIKRSADWAHKSTQYELLKQLNESPFILDQELHKPISVGDALIKPLNESKDSLEIIRKKFAQKQEEPKERLKAGEVLALQPANPLELPKDLKITENQTKLDDLVKTESTIEETTTDEQKTQQSNNETETFEPMELDDSIFGFLDEIYSDLSLSEEDEFREELKAEVRTLHKEMMQKRAASKIPKRCNLKTNQHIEGEQLVKRVNSKNPLEITKKSTKPNNYKIPLMDGNTCSKKPKNILQQSRIPVSIAKRSYSPSLMRPSLTVSTHTTKTVQSRLFIATSPMRAVKSSGTLLVRQKSSLTYVEKQRQLVEILVKGVEEEFKYND